MWRKAILSLVVVALAVSNVAAFAVTRRSAVAKSALNMAMDMPPAPTAVSASTFSAAAAVAQTGPINDGIGRFIANIDDSALQSSSTSISLKERKPPPTKDEIAAKNRNLAWWFWGGGFIAPFLATFYYFGFKFWEK